MPKKPKFTGLENEDNIISNIIMSYEAQSNLVTSAKPLQKI